MIEKYPIDVNDPCVFWGRTKKQYYWGVKCGGTLNENAKCSPVVPGQFVFKNKRWGRGSNNSGKRT